MHGCNNSPPSSGPTWRQSEPQIRAEQAAVDLAKRDYYPDLEVFARYNGFWQGQTGRQLAPMVGVNMNVPLDNARRQAAVREASDRTEQRRWEYQARLDEIHAQVQTAYAQLLETDKVLAVYRQTILPAARQYLDSAQGNYTANTLDFLASDRRPAAIDRTARAI